MSRVHQRSDRLYGHSATPNGLRDILSDGDVSIAVYGLCRNGLSLAVSLAAASGDVVATDPDSDRTAIVDEGAPLRDDDRLQTALDEVIATGALATAESPAIAARSATVHVLTVSPAIDDEVDLAPLLDVLDDVATGLDAGDTVVVESAVPPGDCRDTLYELLVSESGLAAGEFGFVYVPGFRDDDGLSGLESGQPRIVAGADPESATVGRLFFEELIDADVRVVEDLETAEIAAFATAAHHAVMADLSDELARVADAYSADAESVVRTVTDRMDGTISGPVSNDDVRPSAEYVDAIGRNDPVTLPVLERARSNTDSLARRVAYATFDGFVVVDVAPAEAQILVVAADRPDSTGGSVASATARSLTDAGATVHVFGDSSAATHAVDHETATDRTYDAVVVTSPTDRSIVDVDVPELGPDGRALVVVDCHETVTDLRDDDRTLYQGCDVDA